jgi:hypothetical protein
MGGGMRLAPDDCQLLNPVKALRSVATDRQPHG